MRTNPFHASRITQQESIMSKTLFEKIIAREIPAQIVFEDDLVLAIRDIHPQAPVHVLIFPKQPVSRIAEATPDHHKMLGHLLDRKSTRLNSSHRCISY